MTYYKEHTIILGDVKNKKAYAEEHPHCEICNGTYLLAIHHHVKQNARYLSNRYTLEEDCNYSVLCRTCHSIIHAGKSQYNRDIKSPIKWEYWNNLKNGKSLEDYVKGDMDEYI